MAKYLAWLEAPGSYLHVSDEFAGLLALPKESIEGKALSEMHPSEASMILSMMGGDPGELSSIFTINVSPELTLSCQLIKTPAERHWLMMAEPHYTHANAYQPGRIEGDADSAPRLKTSLDRSIHNARTAGSQVVLVKLSIERFDWLQETLGEYTAELVIEEVALRLQGALRRDDTLYRIREDRFLIQLQHVDSADEALAVAQRLHELLGFGVRVDRREIHIASAMGVALAPLQANDAGELMGAVSQALKVALRGDVAGVRLYDPVRQRKALNVDNFASLIKPNYTDMSINFRPIYGVRSHRIEIAQLTPMFKDIPCLDGDENLIAPFFENGGWQTYLSWLVGQLEQPLARLAQYKSFQGVIVRIPANIVEKPNFVEFMSQRINLVQSLRSYVLLEIDALETRDHEGVLFDLEALGYRIVLNRLNDYLPPIQQLKELEPSLLILDADLVADMASNMGHRKQLEHIADIAADLEIPLSADGVQTAGLRMQLSHQGVSYMQGDYFGRLLSSEMLQEQLILENIES